MLSEKALDSNGALDECKFQNLLQAYIQKTYPTTQHLLCDIKKAPIIKIPDGLRPKPGSNSWYDYIINIKYDRYALKGTAYTIKFYLGGPKGENFTHYEPQNYVGSVYTFGGGSRETDSCSNCKKQADESILSCAQVPLTIQLLHHTIDGLTDHPLETFDQVERYLELHLRWKVYGFGGIEVAKKDYEQLSKTEITVLRGIGQPQHVAAPVKKDAIEGLALSSFSLMATDEPMTESNIKNPVAVPPTYDNDSYKPLASITHGKAFGLQKDGGYRPKRE
jgi:tyrosinase